MALTPDERAAYEHFMKNTTPTQRVQWLEDMVEIFADQLLAQRKKEDLELRQRYPDFYKE